LDKYLVVSNNGYNTLNEIKFITSSNTLSNLSKYYYNLDVALGLVEVWSLGGLITRITKDGGDVFTLSRS
jgi:hypothetical protein